MVLGPPCAQRHNTDTNRLTFLQLGRDWTSSFCPTYRRRNAIKNSALDPGYCPGVHSRVARIGDRPPTFTTPVSILGEETIIDSS